MHAIIKYLDFLIYALRSFKIQIRYIFIPKTFTVISLNIFSHRLGIMTSKYKLLKTTCI